jgi:hypothetical protein
VPWLTSGDLDVLDDIEVRPELMLIAHPLADARLRPALARRVRQRLKLGLLLEPEAYLLQLDADRRAEADVAPRVELLLERRGGRHLDLDRRQRAETLDNFARHTLDNEVTALATALVAPAPLLHPIRLDALANAVVLLEAASSYFVSESPAAVYGYLIQVANLGSHPQPRDVRALADFLYALEDRSGRPVLVARVGCLGLGFLTGGLAGYAAGLGLSELLRFPPLPFRPPEARSTGGFSIVSLHQVLLRNLRTLGPNSQAGRLAFHRLPCHCGFHEAGKPPHVNRARKAHNLFWRGRQAQEAVAGGAAWLLEMIARAEAASAGIDGEVEFYAALRETLPLEAIPERRVG